MTSPAFILCLFALGLASVHPQPLLPGEATCEGSQLTKAACVAISCCEWDGGRCWWGGGVCPATATTAKPTNKPATTAKPATTTKPATTAAPTNTGTKVTWTLKTSPFPQLPKYTTVFGATVFAASSVTDAQFQHVASVLAEWLDNDEDGCVDNPLALTKYLAMKPQPAILVPGTGDLTNAVAEAFDKAGYFCNAPLYTGEILPKCSGPAATSSCADATLEEILHMWTSHGFANAYPAAFGIQTSKLTTAMDVARGGKFDQAPASYPAGAWFTYDDTSCGYGCQVTEYVYWGMAAWVGALVGRKTEIQKEWKFETKAKVEAGDALLTALFKNTTVYKVPTISPTGVYKGPATCTTGVNHS